MKKCIVKNLMGIMKNGNEVIFNGGDDLEVSDGYHTFDELYEHRIQIFISCCRAVNGLQLIGNRIGGKGPSLEVWRSKAHSDGSIWDGWFILGIHKKPGKQITYHLPISKWEETNFAETLEKAPEYDGHTSQDVLDRLKSL